MKADFARGVGLIVFLLAGAGCDSSGGEHPAADVEPPPPLRDAWVPVEVGVPPRLAPIEPEEPDDWGPGEEWEDCNDGDCDCADGEAPAGELAHCEVGTICSLPLNCVDLGHGRRCHRPCVMGEVNACAPGTYCHPATLANDWATRTDGHCRPGPAPACVPGDEVATCGEEATCLHTEFGDLCLPGGDRGLGETCRPSPSYRSHSLNCRPGLYCAAGICRPACAPDGRCPDGGGCIEASEGVRYCQETCDVIAQDGCDGAACVLQDFDRHGEAVARCEAVEVGAGTTHATCRPGNDYWGDCAPNHVCIDDGLHDGALVCAGFCHRDDPRLCTGGSGCSFYAAGTRNLGLCVGDCLVFGEGAGCPDGRRCVFAFITGTGHDEPRGVCRPGQQAPQTGEPCTPWESGEDDCSTGDICLRGRDNDVPRCHRLCDAARTAVTCPPGTDCLADLFSAPGEPTNPHIGVCLPAPAP